MTIHFIYKLTLFCLIFDFSATNEDVCDASDKNCDSSEHRDKSDIYKKGSVLLSDCLI